MKIFFDLDGTLINVSPRHYRVYQEVVSRYGGEPLGQSEYWNLKRRKVKWPVLLTESRLDPNIQADFLSEFIALIEDPAYLQMDELFPGALSVLQQAANQHTCYLVSLRRNYNNLLAEVEELGIKGYFEDILSGHSESDGSDKKIELIKQKIDDPKDAVIIGDTEADILTGQRLNIKTVAVLSGIRDKAFLNKLQPDYILEDVSKIDAII